MKLTTLLALFLLSSPQVFPFSSKGHQTVAAVAAPLLTPATQTAIHDILGTGDIQELLMKAATWPDDIKSTGSSGKTSAAKKFNLAHPGNSSWHFVNFPVGATKYSASSSFAGPHDVVQMINQCIRILEGDDTPDHLSQKEALRFLVHLVGDVHQPLHVVAGYYDLTDPAHPKLEQDEDEMSDDLQDRGGLKLITPLGDMHHMWDFILVDDVAPTTLATDLMQGAPAPATFKTSGKYTTWAAKWATDSIKIGKLAYDDIQFGAATLHDGSLGSITVTLSPTLDAYQAKHKPTVRNQLRKAGIHLAQLLNAIQWEETP